MKKRIKIFSGLVFISLISLAQIPGPDWVLKFSSIVESNNQGFGGVDITLYEGSKKVSQSITSGGGDFVVEVPANGEFILVVSKPGYNTKKFSLNTKNVPEGMDKNNFKPVLRLEGITMSKPIPGVDYSPLNEPLLKASYQVSGKKFSDDAAYTNQMLAILSKIRDQERIILERYAAANKAGDEALKKSDCDKAKQSYSTASSILPDEQYPKDQLLKAEKCVSAKDEEKKKAEEAKLAAEKAASEKAAADKLAAEKAAADKAAADKAAAEKLAAEKAAAEKAAADKAAADKLAAQKAAAEKFEADKAAKEKAAADKLAAQKAASDKAAADKAAKQKEAAEKAAADKLAEEQAAKEKADAARIAREKEAAEKKEGIIVKDIDPVTNTPGDPDVDAKHRIAATLGTDKYKETIKKADGYFKMKRWAEAKTAYEEALKLKTDDPYAKGKLSEIEKLSAPK